MLTPVPDQTDLHPGMDDQDLLLYSNDSTPSQSYALVLIMLLKRSSHYYIYSETAWNNGLEEHDVHGYYDLIDDQYLKTHTISEFEEDLRSHFAVTFHESLLYNNALVEALLSLENETTLKRSIENFEGLAQRFIENGCDDVNMIKCAMNFTQWVYYIYSEVTHNTYQRERGESIALLSQMLFEIDEKDDGAFIFDIERMIGDYYQERNNPVLARKYDLLALRCLEHIDEQNTVEKVMLLEKLGDLEKEEKPDLAIHYLEEAEILLEREEQKDDLVNCELAIIKQSLGKIYMKKNDPQAEMLFIQSLNLLRSIYEHDANQENQHNYIIALHVLAGYYGNRKGHYDLKARVYIKKNYDETYAYECEYGHPETSYALSTAAYQAAITHLLAHDESALYEGLVYMQKYAKILENRYERSKMEKQGREMAVATFHLARASHLIDDPHTFEIYGHCVESFKKVAHAYPTHDNVSVYLDICHSFYEFVEEKHDDDQMQKARLLAIDNVRDLRGKYRQDPSFYKELASALLALGQLYVKMKGSDKCSHGLHSFEEVLQYARDEATKSIRLEAKRALAFLYMREPVFDEKKSLALLKEILNESLGERDYALAQAYENLGIFYTRQHKPESYKEAYHYHHLEEAIFMELYEDSKDPNDLRNYIISLKQMAHAAECSEDVDQQEEACELYEQACQKSEILYLEHHASALDLADLYEKCGLAHSRFMTHDHLEKALKAFKTALDYLPKDEFTYYLRLEERCGQMCMALKDYDEALDHYQLYMDVINHITREQPESLSHQDLLANGYHHLGIVKRMLKQFEESSKDFKEELTIRTDIYHKEENEENRYKMACVHRYLGDNLQLLKQDVQALGNYKVLNYHMKALQKEPKARKMLALSEEKIGNIYKRYGDEFHLKQALEYYQKVYDLIEPVHDERSMVAILQKIAYVYGRLGKDYYGEAMALYQKQATILRNLCAVDEKYKDDYASCLNNQGVLLRVSDPKGAIALFEKVVNLRKASTTTPQHLLKLGNTFRLLADLTKEKSYYRQAISCFEKSKLKAAEPYKRACEQALKEVESLR